MCGTELFVSVDTRYVCIVISYIIWNSSHVAYLHDAVSSVLHLVSQ
jgi:hypothetical protein